MKFYIWSTIVFALVITFLAGLLIPTRIPLHQQRISTKEDVCRRKLSSILLALQNYHDDYGCYPPAQIFDDTGKPVHSWRALILPYLDFYEYNLFEPWDSPHNALLYDKAAELYRCPNENKSSTCTSYLMATSDNNAAFSLGPEKYPYVIVIEAFNTGIICLEPRDLSYSDIEHGIRQLGDAEKKIIPGSIHCSKGKEGCFYVGLSDLSIKILPATTTPMDLLKMLPSIYVQRMDDETE